MSLDVLGQRETQSMPRLQAYNGKVLKRNVVPTPGLEDVTCSPRYAVAKRRWGKTTQFATEVEKLVASTGTGGRILSPPSSSAPSATSTPTRR